MTVFSVIKIAGYCKSRVITHIYTEERRRIMKQYIVDAFTDEVFHGNQAAICILDQ